MTQLDQNNQGLNHENLSLILDLFYDFNKKKFEHNELQSALDDALIRLHTCIKSFEHMSSSNKIIAETLKSRYAQVRHKLISTNQTKVAS
jgi:hypothetical protein